ncbi:MAG: hypothetical protein M0Q91_05945 [Methanoregula sp.]|nr:hypothetical protein [Methanoregula sp.]
MADKQKIAENGTNVIISFFLNTRHGLLVISTILVLIPIFYQMIFSQQLLTQNFVLSLFILGIYGYAIFIADIFVEILRRDFSIIHKQMHEGLYNPLIFVILTIFIIMGLYFAFGFDAIKNISLALLFLVVIHWPRGRRAPLFKS